MLYQLSYGPLTSISVYTLQILTLQILQTFNGQGRNRTTDTTIFSRVLYQLSYLARYLARCLARYLARKKTARPFGDGRLGEGCALRAS